MPPPPVGVLCPTCQSCLDFDYTPPSMDVHRSSRYDVSCTYDLRCLFSERFIIWAEENNLLSREDFRFIPTKHEFKYYYLLTNKLPVLPCDTIRSKTEFSSLCTMCHQPTQIIRGDFLKIESFPHQGFFRMDIPLAHNKSKSYVSLVDLETGDLMKKQKFRGLDLSPCYGFLDPDDANVTKKKK